MRGRSTASGVGWLLGAFCELRWRRELMLGCGALTVGWDVQRRGETSVRRSLASLLSLKACAQCWMSSAGLSTGIGRRVARGGGTEFLGPLFLFHLVKAVAVGVVPGCFASLVLFVVF